ncbi:YbhB/YbcL family Raf kinase inhibitor-like protein [Mesomycoplasma molare]|uniref:YbhB/YbcL family Raf kinase inhibitor-like protein n=1 Tax=Mesomycoplasma molare TaxID=171288 RepID=A0ABY5TTH1_9BACT|nr:YbhB/YbcL family Raf kinase inhibitor-like protein [Mesomycoplasma molare]UWD33885.1 YbhB/YbcL family Raf kinase inhibitor-like protein [Mesomycoplasma molare]
MKFKNKKLIIGGTFLTSLSLVTLVSCGSPVLSQPSSSNTDNSETKSPTTENKKDNKDNNNNSTSNETSTSKETNGSVEEQKSETKLTITSSAIVQGVLNDRKYISHHDESTLSRGQSLPLSWNSIKDAKSYAVIMLDKTATEVVGKVYTHWGIFNIPANKTQLEDNYSETVKNDSNIKQMVTSGQEANEKTYIGPNPPTEHIYEVRVYALNSENINVSSSDGNFYLNNFLSETKDKIISEGVLTFSYGPENKTNGNLYATENIGKINIESNALENNLLKNGYFKESNESNTENLKTIPFEWNKIEGASSYLVWLEDYSDSNREKNFVSILWGRINIENPTEGNKVVITEENFNSQNVTNNILNSSYISPYASYGMDPEQPRNNENANKFLLPEATGDKSNNIYVLRVLALNKKLTKQNNQANPSEMPSFDEYGHPPINKDVLGSYLLEAKQSVIAEGSLIFKLK